MNRHPQTGKIISNADAERIAERQPMVHPVDHVDLLAPTNAPVAVMERPVDDTPFTPVRVWTAGWGMVQEKIVMPGKPGGLKPERDGSYHLTTRDEYDVAKRALGARFWPDDVPEGMESLKCDTCQWTTRSMRAFQAHSNSAHGRPQGTN